MEVILNIGLAQGTNGNIGFGTALRELSQAGFSISEYRLLHSDTEPTVVARTTFNSARGLLHTAAFCVSVLLDQDCVAIYLPATNEGHLVGPRASTWGEFNPEYFIQLDGTRLAAPALARAA
jgi:hypothetical protein